MRRLVVPLACVLACITAAWSWLSTTTGTESSTGRVDVAASPTEAIASLRVELSRELSNNGPQASVDMLLTAVESNPSVAMGCHSLAHELGREAARIYPQESLVSLAPGVCQSGFMHGVLQIAALDPDTSADVCDQVLDPYRSGCAHGYGHLLVERYPQSLYAALVECAEFFESTSPGTAKDVARCGGGAAMEYGYAFAREARVLEVETSESMGPVTYPTVDLPAEQLEDPCRPLRLIATGDLDGVHHECTIHAALFWIDSTAASFRDAISRCTLVVSDAPEICEHSVGLRFTEVVLADPRTAPTAHAIMTNRCTTSALTSSCETGLYTALMVRGVLDTDTGCIGSHDTDACRSAQELIQRELLQ